MAAPVRIREATLKDLPALLELEQRGFPIDRFDEEHFVYLLTEARAITFVAEVDGRVRGSAVMLWRRGSSAGHLYSIVADPGHQGRGLGGRLLQTCEEAAARRGCTRMLLQVRTDNAPAITFYRRRGFKDAGALQDYYADGAPALQMVKRLDGVAAPSVRLDVPYFPQSLGFTCGPACLMMAMKYFTPELPLKRALELMLWKEATLIFMTSGTGGCGPHGLAVAAQRRGYPAKVVTASRRTPFLSSVRSKEKKAVIRLVDQELKEEARALGVRSAAYDFTFEDIAGALREDVIPIVLISTYRLHKVRAPHWVVITGFDSEDVYFHDPYEGFYVHDKGKARDVRIPIPEFGKMRRYGSDVTRSVLFVGRPPEA